MRITDNMKVHRFVLKKLQEVRFTCEMCNETFELGKKVDHAMQCRGNTIECPALNCTAVIEVSHINEHLTQDCTGVRFQCKKCTQRVSRGQRSAHECMPEMVTLLSQNKQLEI